MGHEIAPRTAPVVPEYQPVFPADQLAPQLIPVAAHAIKYRLGTSYFPALVANGNLYVRKDLAEQTFAHPDVFTTPKKIKGIRTAPNATVFSEKDSGAVWSVCIDPRTGQQRLERFYDPTQKPITSAILPGLNAVEWNAQRTDRVQRRHEQLRKQRRHRNLAVGLIGFLSVGVLAAESIVSPETPSLMNIYSVVPKTETKPTSSSHEAPQPNKPPITDTTSITLNIGTWNNFIRNKPQNVEQGITNALNGVKDPNDPNKYIESPHQILVTQESLPFAKTIAKIACEACNFGAFPGTKGGNRGKNQIIYDKRVLTLLETKSLKAPSDPGHRRIVNWGLFRINRTKIEFYAMVVHAPHQSEKDGLPSKRKASVKAHKRYIVFAANEYKRLLATGKAAFVAGDMNEDQTEGQQVCVEKDFTCWQFGPVAKTPWIDAELSGEYKNLNTQGTGDRRIDDILFSSGKNLEIDLESAWVLPGKDGLKGGSYGSDHKLTSARLRFILQDEEQEQPPDTLPIKLEGIDNFRDTSDSNDIIKPGMVYRSSDLSGATDADKAVLRERFKGGFVIDLRAMKTRAKEPDQTIGVANLNAPIDGASSSSGYIKEYVRDAANRQEFADALGALAEARGPVLIHCVYGKDRTGILVALLMTILGADQEQIMTEYMKSNDYGAHVEAAWLEDYIGAAEKRSGSLMKFITDKDGLGVSQATIQTLREKFGA